MKYFLSAFLLLSFLEASTASVPRKPLIEELTSSTCTFCDLSDSVVDAYIAAHAEEVCVLKWYMLIGNYQGENPFYHAYPKAEKRWTYYGGPGVPQLRGNGGNQVNPYAGTAAINTAFAVTIYDRTSPFTIEVDQAIVGDSLECVVRVTLVDAAFDMSALRLGIAISEREIHFKENTTMVNSTSIHTNVVRATVPEFENGAPAIALPPMTQNQTVTFTYRVAINTLWDPTMLQTTAFIQDINTKEVFQSEMSATPAAVASHTSNLQSSVYPNPSSGVVNVSLRANGSSNVVFEVYDATGKPVFRNTLTSWLDDPIVAIDLSHLPSGSYSYQLRAGEMIETRRIVIQR